MKTKIIILGVVLTAFLMLMMPSISAANTSVVKQKFNWPPKFFDFFMPGPLLGMLGTLLFIITFRNNEDAQALKENFLDWLRDLINPA